MLEKLVIDGLAKLAEQTAAKAGEVRLQGEVTRQMAQQESFRVGEVTSPELRDLSGIKEREIAAADELRAYIIEDNAALSSISEHADGIDENSLRSTQGEAPTEGLSGVGGIKNSSAENLGLSTDVVCEPEKPQIVQNKQDGCRREEEVLSELREKYAPDEGYNILRERDIVSIDGLPVKDPYPMENKQPEGRRIDFVVIDKDKNVVDCLEVTSLTAPKGEQVAKEQRIRENGGHFVRDPDSGQLYDIAQTPTRIERRS